MNSFFSNDVSFQSFFQRVSLVFVLWLHSPEVCFSISVLHRLFFASPLLLVFTWPLGYLLLAVQFSQGLFCFSLLVRFPFGFLSPPTSSSCLRPVLQLRGKSLFRLFCIC